MIRVPLTTALALIFVASAPLHLRANAETSGLLTAKEVRQAEASAKTASDHARLAAYYQGKARQTQTKLADAEEMMKHYSWLSGSTKLPNAYSSAQTNAGAYRAELEKETKLAADHQKLAESLQASAR